MADNMGVNPFVEDDIDPLAGLVGLVYDYAKNTVGYESLSISDVKVVWFSKSLGNWKGLAITSRPDGLYYEVTHNGAKDEVYLDVYHKVDHEVIPVFGEEDS